LLTASRDAFRQQGCKRNASGALQADRSRRSLSVHVCNNEGMTMVITEIRFGLFGVVSVSQDDGTKVSISGNNLCAAFVRPQADGLFVTALGFAGERFTAFVPANLAGRSFMRNEHGHLTEFPRSMRGS